jgi:hypothetical protein
LAAANAAALGAFTGTAVVMIAGIAIWLADTAVRAGLLITVSTANPLPPAPHPAHPSGIVPLDAISDGHTPTNQSTGGTSG